MSKKFKTIKSEIFEIYFETVKDKQAVIVWLKLAGTEAVYYSASELLSGLEGEIPYRLSATEVGKVMAKALPHFHTK